MRIRQAPRGQGQGLAHALLRHACQLAREHGRRFLREDPRLPLAEPFESQRRHFLPWYRGIHPGSIWSEVEKQ